MENNISLIQTAKNYEILLQNLMSSDNNVRKSSETSYEQLKYQNPHHALVIASISTNHDNLNFSVELRQFAAVLLRRLVDQHWCSASENSNNFVLQSDVKKSLYEMILVSLGGESQKLNSSHAYVLATILKWEENIKDLLTTFPNMIKEKNQLDGVLIVLHEVWQDAGIKSFAADFQMYLAKLVEIIQNNNYNTYSKCLSVDCLIACFKSFVDESTIIPDDFLFNFTIQVVLKKLKNNQETWDLKIKLMSFLTETLMYKCNLNKTKNTERIVEIVSTIWEILKEAKEPYLNGFIKDDNSHGSCSIYLFVKSILMFVEDMFECGKYNKLVKESMKEMVSLLLFYLQLTDDEVEMFTENPDKLIEDDDSATTVRTQCLHILENSCEAGPLSKSFKSVIFPVIQEQIGIAAELKKAGNSKWWRLQEACYYVISCKQDTMLKCIDRVVGKNEILMFLFNLVIPDLSCDIALLACRAILVCSSFSSLLPDKDVTQLVSLLLPNLNAPKHEIMQIFAIRAFYMIFEGYKPNQALDAYIEPVFKACLSFVNTVEEEVTKERMFELIVVMIKIKPEMTQPYQMPLMNCMLKIIDTTQCDMLLKIYCEEIFNLIGPLGLCVDGIKQLWLPYITSLLSLDKPDDSGFYEFSISILSCIARYAKPPFNLHLVNTCFPYILKAVNVGEDDASVYVGACECIRAFLRSSSTCVSEYKNDQGQNGIQIIFNILVKVLNDSSEAGEGIKALIGKLLSAFVLNYSNVLASTETDALLKLTLSNMSATKIPTEMESLAGVFVHLFYSNTQGAVEYLSNISLDDSHGYKNALEYVVCTLCEIHPGFLSKYDKKASLITMFKILEFGLSTNNQILNNITTKGDEIHLKSIRTRSATKKVPMQYTTVPLYIKLYKFLLQEIQNLLEDEDLEEDYVTDESDDDYSEEDNFLGDLSFDGYDDDDNEEEEVIDPNIMNVDLKQFLCEAVTKILNDSITPFLTQHLNEQEQKLLKQLVQSSNK